jgi:hypothetical protein
MQQIYHLLSVFRSMVQLSKVTWKVALLATSHGLPRVGCRL